MAELDRKLDLIFDLFDNLFLSHDFKTADLLIELMNPNADLTLVLGVLSITLCAKDDLPSRAKYFRYVSQRHDAQEENLLIGLE